MNSAAADGYKSPQRDALRFIFCRRRCLRRRLFVAFSEREPFLRGFPVWEVWEVLVQKLYLGVKKMCKKFREILTVLIWQTRFNEIAVSRKL